MQRLKNFTKDDLANSLVENVEVGISKAQAIHAVDDIVASIECALQRGEVITLRGFGTLRVVNRKAKVARNITTGAKVDVPARATAKFTPSKQLKNLLNDHDNK